MQPVVSISNMVFGWPGEKPFLLVDSLRLDPGELVFLEGKSGSGKSTLLSLASGLLLPDSGEIFIQECAVNRLSPARRDTLRGDRIGFIFQQFNLIPYLSVEENITAPLRFSTTRKKRVAGDSRQQCRRLLDELQLDVSPRKRVDALSVGQRQRVAAARALLGSPPLILADEPCSALDQQTGDDFINLLLSECRRYKIGLLYVSHDVRRKHHFSRTLSMNSLNSFNHNQEKNL